jgi:hypothetical protein
MEQLTIVYASINTILNLYMQAWNRNLRGGGVATKGSIASMECTLALNAWQEVKGNVISLIVLWGLLMASEIIPCLIIIL